MTDFTGRRKFLQGLGLTGLAAFLSSCGRHAGIFADQGQQSAAGGAGGLTGNQPGTQAVGGALSGVAVPSGGTPPQGFANDRFRQLTLVAPIDNYKGPTRGGEFGLYHSFAEASALNSLYGGHAGLDMGGINTKIYATAPGVVVTSASEVSWGGKVSIAHTEAGILPDGTIKTGGYIENGKVRGDYWVSSYGHVEPRVKAGDIVKTGDVIAEVTWASTPRGVTGPHLHFQVIPHGPATYGENLEIGTDKTLLYQKSMVLRSLNPQEGDLPPFTDPEPYLSHMISPNTMQGRSPPMTEQQIKNRCNGRIPPGYLGNLELGQQLEERLAQMFERALHRPVTFFGRGGRRAA